jgi:hypothetical protein
MREIIRHPGALIVQVPNRKTAFSVTEWYTNENDLLRFIDSIYVCRDSSERVEPNTFSDILAGLEN